MGELALLFIGIAIGSLLMFAADATFDLSGMMHSTISRRASAKIRKLRVRCDQAEARLKQITELEQEVERLREENMSLKCEWMKALRKSGRMAV